MPLISASMDNINPGTKIGEYICQTQLGSGSFGVVHVWRHHKSGQVLALKKCRFGTDISLSDQIEQCILDLILLLTETYCSSQHREQWRQEVDILQRLEHPNVVKSMPVPKDLWCLEDELPLMCMEFCSGGDLRKVLNMPTNCCGLPQAEIMAIISDLASALGFLHNRRIIHRDLKPENVVLQPSHKRTIYKLIDLGYAKELGQSSLALSFVGTLQYIAPELFLSQEYTKSVDYWSLGFLSHEIMTGRRPFLPNLSPAQWMEHVQKKSRRDICVHQCEETDEIRFEEHLFPENSLTLSLADDFEGWLRSLLEWSPIQRGKNENGEIAIFKDLGDILAKTRIRVVCVDRGGNKLDYVVKAITKGKDIQTWLERDTGIRVGSQLNLMPNGKEIQPEDGVISLYENGEHPRVLYCYSTEIGLSVSEKIQKIKIILPKTVESCLQNPRKEVSLPMQKSIHSHAHFFCSQENKQSLDFDQGLKVLILYLLIRIKGINNTFNQIEQRKERTLSKLELFHESLTHDKEKYKEQSKKEVHITSAQIYESWNNSERDLSSFFEEINAKFQEIKIKLAEVNPMTAAIQKIPKQRPEDLQVFVKKSIQGLEDLRRIPIEGRKEKDTVLDVAQNAVRCLKQRDRNLQEHFNKKDTLMQALGKIRSAHMNLEALSSNLDLFTSQLSKSQRKRQSDLWKLLAAALQQQKGQPISPSSGNSMTFPQHQSQSQQQQQKEAMLYSENQALRAQLQEYMKIDLVFFQGCAMDYAEIGNGEQSENGGFNPDAGVYEGSNYVPEGEFSLLNNVLGDGLSKENDVGISALAFDSHEELLWMGTKSGHVTSYYGPQLQKYTSFQVHPTEEVRNIVTLDQNVLALTQSSLRGQIRRGIPVFTHTSSNLIDMHSLLQNPRTGRILMGGIQDRLIDFDVTSSKEFKVHQLSAGGSCAILRSHNRFICCGDASNGKVMLRDPASLRVTQTLDAHSGYLTDFDVYGNHLVTCGQSIRQGMAQPDRFLMMYDLRILRAINPLQVMILPYQLRFLPTLSSQVAVLSSMGQVQLVDTAELATPNINIFQVAVPIEGCNTISMDISPSRQCMAFGDTTNSIHLYSSLAEPVLNPYARETEFADTPANHTPISIEDEMAIYSSIPRPNLPPGQTTYLSDYWPDRFCKAGYRPTPVIDPEILRTMKVVGSIGYARNIGNVKRNQMRYPHIHTKDAKGDFRDGQSEKHSPGLMSIPKTYRKIAIKITKIGQDEFDFDRYNRTGFCGLEAALPNSYCNAMLQTLYYTEHVRLLTLNHTCVRENCVVCELSFLFHMMDISPGIPCQSSNFLRALRTIPEASALGLVFSDQHSMWASNVPRLIQSWNRFILHQIANQLNVQELGLPSTTRRNHTNSGGSDKKVPLVKATSIESDDSVDKVDTAASDTTATENDVFKFNRMFGLKQEKVNVCTKCKTTNSTQDTLLLCNLNYPDGKASATFEDVVCSSLCPKQMTPAWCEKCRKYQPTNQNRKLLSLPYHLSLNAGLDNPQDIAFWSTQMNRLFLEHCKEEELSPKAPSQSIPPPNAKPCRYGLSCNRPDCKFWHPEQEVAIKESEDIGDKLHRLGVSWIPEKIQLNRLANGEVRSTSTVHEEETDDDDGNDDDDKEVVEACNYHLQSICYTILDPLNSQAHNVVAAINVGPFYHSRVASAVSQWYTFNDFSINPIMPSEARWVNLTWKLPCIFVFQCEEQPKILKEIVLKNPITQEIFKKDRSLVSRGGRKRITFTPLSPEEMPKSGDLVAIDAEFVTLNQEESELRSDGKVSTIKAAHMSVARITCVRGSGEMEGVPFIDDYISTQEQVVDYVTKYSGILPGDLDANSSSKHLTTLKSTYKKLRYLVDMGCIFIGHGLKNDFKVINLVVPVEQVVDTVLLFHLPHNRMISLKFLAWYFLKKKIQGATHDSIEDAVTALELYKKYLELKKSDTLIEELNNLYDRGKVLNWKVPEDQE
ncbi:hypothetical protein TCAL_00495 [Tigriopus californicus]|uniref:PAN2-PAN3 deadenylation complex catalytic subunit PAN2 n=1 Tax=Tigriopus californicus TaxID=6832 RepID=A0A553NFI9_TIGCA|nr:hypothetical protein TCAL_00495 [Tigriopus californicus]